MVYTLHDTQLNKKDTAVLVMVTTQEIKRSRMDMDHYTDEMQSLANTAGVEVVSVFTQKREKLDTRWCIGKGKVEELRAISQELGVTMVLFDHELSGTQVRNLEQYLDVKIIDRTQLILDIFAQRAKTREGIIQVELAQLTYLLPRLAGHYKNLSRLGGGIGTRGPGETQLEIDRRHIRDRIHDLKQQLIEVRSHRLLHRQRRKKSGIIQVGLVGYTNAGKSTLLKQLTNADVYIEDQLFATLDPTSRVMKLPGGNEIVMIDTVGFIQNLSTHLIEAFQATLEEVNEVDLLLHVVDASSPMRNEHINVVNNVLEKLGAAHKPQLILFNKKDVCTSEQLQGIVANEHCIMVSARDEKDHDKIRMHIQQKVTGNKRFFRIPVSRSDMISHIYNTGHVINTTYELDEVIYEVQPQTGQYEKYKHLLEPFLKK